MKYAIVESGGKQFRAVEGATIEVDRLPDATGTNIKLEQVLLLADGEKFTVGRPVIKDTPVWATVVEHFKGEKVTIFNYSPKKRIRVKTGHRQNYTRLLIEQIGGSTLVKKEPVQKVEKVAKIEKAARTEKPKAAAKPAPKAEKKPAPKSEPRTTKAAVKPAAKPTKTAPKPKAEAKTPASKGKPAPKKSKSE